jgi:hypothetical protein
MSQVTQGRALGRNVTATELTGTQLVHIRLPQVRASVVGGSPSLLRLSVSGTEASYDSSLDGGIPQVVRRLRIMHGGWRHPTDPSHGQPRAVSWWSLIPVVPGHKVEDATQNR